MSLYQILNWGYGMLEEQGCLDHYGDSYREYMKRTPRWIGMPRTSD